MKNQPLYSIITPTFNHELFISECIKSVINQTYTNWEMIIIDDGSDDNTFEIASKISKCYENIHLYKQENKGPYKLAETYNFGLKKAKGDYICILEGDDLWAYNKLELQNEVLHCDSNIILCWGRINIIDTDSNILNDSRIKEVRKFFFNTAKNPIIEHLYLNPFMPAVSLVIKSDALNKIGGFQYVKDLPLIDFPTILELTLHGKFYFIDQPIASWRHYVNQVTKSYTVEIRKGLYQASLAHYNRNLSHPIIKKINWSKIESNFKNKLVIVYSRMGRYNLVKKRYKLARKNYYLSIQTNGFNNIIWKLRSIIGLIMSYLRLDVEWLARLFGRVSYK